VIDVRALAACYGTCRSYRDDGSSVVRVRDEAGSIETRVRFATAFTRDPLRLRFVVESTVGTSHAKTAVLHCVNGVSRILSSSLREPVVHLTVARAIDAMGNESEGLSSLILPLLLRRGETLLSGSAISPRTNGLEIERRGHELTVRVERTRIVEIHDRWEHAYNAVDQRTRFDAEHDVALDDADFRFDVSFPRRVLLS
jgi:hypothetical protein